MTARPQDPDPRERLGRGARRLLADLFLHQGAEARSNRRAALYTAVVLLIALPFGRDLFSTAAPPLDLHARLSFQMAVARVHCSRPHHVAFRYPLVEPMAEDPALVGLPVPALVTELASSRSAYCEAAAPFVNNEASLMWVMALLLALDGDASLASLGGLLTAFRLLLLAPFVFVLLRSGASLLLSLATHLCALGILRELSIHYHYSVYAFLFVLVLLAVALLGLIYLYRLYEKPGPAILSFLCFGFFIGFAVNMRSSYLPLLGAQLALFLPLLFVRLRPSRGALKALGACLLCTLCAVGGFFLFHLLFIRPIGPAAVGANARTTQHHAVGHPLVLSLALPPNDLARREGIEWNDVVGLDLARRVDPEVGYLQPGYDTALLRYYRDLWRRYPAEMRDVYRSKLSLAGRHRLEVLKERWLTAARAPAAAKWKRRFAPTVRELRVPGGGVLLAFFALFVATSVGWHVASGRPFPLVLALLGLAALLLHLEATIITPYFQIIYQNFSLFFDRFVVILAAQGILGGLVLAARRGRHEISRRRGGGDAAAAGNR